MKKKQNAFTFIEVLVVLTVIAFTLPALFAIIFAIFRQETQIYVLRNLKTQGDYVLQNMKNNIIQRGKDVVDAGFQNSVCPILTSPTPTPFNRINLKDKENRNFSYFISSSKVASSSALSLLYLTHQNVQVSDLSFTCFKSNSFSPPVITVSFIIADSVDNQIKLPFYASFQMRSY